MLEIIKKVCPLIKHRNFYRLQSPFISNQTVWLFESPEKSHYQLFVLKNFFKVSQYHNILRLPYINQGVNYADQYGRRFSGAELVHSDIHIPFASGDFQSYTLELSRL